MKALKIYNCHSFIKARSFLQFVLTVSTFFIGALSAVASADKNAITTPQNEDKLIFIAPGSLVSDANHLYVYQDTTSVYIAVDTIIYGSENLFDIKSGTTKELVTQKKDKISRKKAIAISKNIAFGVHDQDKLKNLLQKRSKQKMHTTLYSSKSDRKYDRWRGTILVKQLSPSSYSSTKTHTVVYSDYNRDAFKIQKVAKHKRYASFTYLDFPILRNSVLRGPPVYQTM